MSEKALSKELIEPVFLTTVLRVEQAVIAIKETIDVVVNAGWDVSLVVRAYVVAAIVAAVIAAIASAVIAVIAYIVATDLSAIVATDLGAIVAIVVIIVAIACLVALPTLLVNYATDCKGILFYSLVVFSFLINGFLCNFGNLAILLSIFIACWVPCVISQTVSVETQERIICGVLLLNHFIFIHWTFLAGFEKVVKVEV